MAALGRMTSALRGALWLVRAKGLRASLEDASERLNDLDARIDEAARRLAESYRREWEEAQRRDAEAARRQRWLESRDLRAFERCVYSQNGEDGIIEEIFRRIGAETRTFVEFGVESGVECNCARLALEGNWRGLFLEADEAHFARLSERYRGHQGVRCARAVVTSANIEELLAAHEVPRSFDLLSIDIDGNDYWVWRAVRNWRPRVVAVEYNAGHPPPQRWVMKEDPDYRWNGTTYYGASLASLTALARAKGYALVGTNSTGVNAFFVLEELATPDRFLDPVLQYHYSPPSYGRHRGTHPPGSGPYVEV